MEMIDDRRRRSFDEDAEQYERARPGYPLALFDHIVDLSGISPGARLLEVGCGTGKATIEFARRGFAIECIELGPALADFSRKRFEAFPNVSITTGAFESFRSAGEPFDLLISGSAYHWIDPKVRYEKAAQVLKHGGAIALFWNKHVQTEASRGFFEAVQKVYEAEAPELTRKNVELPDPANIPFPVKDEIDTSGLFGDVMVRKYSWQTHYDAHGYTDLLFTYSEHRILEEGKRKRLFRGVETMIDSAFGGQVTREWVTVLYIASRV